ncbi:MAG TPA: ribose-phosphate diphosphokinase [Candidatus Thermoplasmatota archaeon]|jgi:ribose-phosphate pyrophosphokinase|nr:ribose-phosphate diphosphokinase [Candidatus Thermoplasmatota archaeon]
MLLVPGPRSPLLGERLGRALGAQVAQVEQKHFPDGEAYVRVATPLRGEDVVVVQTTWPNEALVALLLLQDAVRRRGARSVTVIVPYFAYARQDRTFLDGEPVSAEAVMKLIGHEADRVITVDLHRPDTLKVLGKATKNVSAIPAIADHFRALPPQVVLAPDKNALERAKECAALLGAEVDHLVKKRVAADTVEITTHDLEVAGLRVLIVDDIISTGGTMVAAAQELRRQGATSVSAACTHGLFAPGALDKLHAAGLEQTVATDTIEGPASAVSVAPELAKVLKGA